MSESTPRMFNTDELTQARTEAERRDDASGYWYAWGRLDQGHAPVAGRLDVEREPSTSSTAWLFGAMWMQSKREFRDPENTRVGYPGMQAAWENFVASHGHSIFRR